MLFNTKAKDNILFFLILISFAILPLYQNLTWIATFLLLPIVAASLIFERKSLKFTLNVFHKRFLLFFLFAIISFLFAKSFDNYIYEFKRLLGVLLVFSVFFLFVKRDTLNVFRLYLIIYLKFVFIILFTFFSDSLSFDTGSRLDSGSEIGLNANIYGYFSFFSLYISALLMFLRKSYWTKFIFIFTFIISVTINIFAASRAGLSFNILSIIFILYSINYKSFNFWYIILFSVILFSILNIDIDFSDFSIYNRFNDFVESNEEARFIIFNEGIKFFLENPFGHGGGQFEYLMLEYSYFNKIAAAHNSFLSIAVNYGIQGLLVFLSLFYLYLKDSIKLIKGKKFIQKRYGMFFLSFLVLFFSYNFFYDFIYNLYLMSMFILTYIHQRLIIKNLIPLAFR